MNTSTEATVLDSEELNNMQVSTPEIRKSYYLNLSVQPLAYRVNHVKENRMMKLGFGFFLRIKIFHSHLIDVVEKMVWIQRKCCLG